MGAAGPGTNVLRVVLLPPSVNLASASRRIREFRHKFPRPERNEPVSACKFSMGIVTFQSPAFFSRWHAETASKFPMGVPIKLGTQTADAALRPHPRCPGAGPAAVAAASSNGRYNIGLASDRLEQPTDHSLNHPVAVPAHSPCIDPGAPDDGTRCPQVPAGVRDLIEGTNRPGSCREEQEQKPAWAWDQTGAQPYPLPRRRPPGPRPPGQGPGRARWRGHASAAPVLSPGKWSPLLCAEHGKRYPRTVC